MAWKAIITGFDVALPGVNVGYFDDADPANSPTPTNFLYTRTFSRSESESTTALRQAVIQVGQDKRAVYTRLKAMQGTTVVIP